MNLTALIHEFVDGIVRHGEEPSFWPISRDEQIAFVRSTINQARQISRSEPYLAQAVEIAAQQVKDREAETQRRIERHNYRLMEQASDISGKAPLTLDEAIEIINRQCKEKS